MRSATRFAFLSLLFGAPAAAGTISTVTFDQYSPLATNTELARRFLTPLAAAAVPQRLAQMGKTLSAWPVKLSEESFLLYVPLPPPPGGYGLLVFIPPWDSARLPDGWEDVLDRNGLIFVSASRSGNDQSDLGRREPLALLAEENVAARYKLNPDRIFIGGFSGGSRVAMRTALAYPDVFRGALLDAGSDAIGNERAPMPGPELLHRFQEATRLVYITGARDITRLSMDSASIRSMRNWCQFNIEEIRPDSDHTVADPHVFGRAIDALLEPISPDSSKLVSCREAIDADLSAQVQQFHALEASGKADEARTLLTDIDRHFGGLAAAETVQAPR